MTTESHDNGSIWDRVRSELQRAAPGLGRPDAVAEPARGIERSEPKANWARLYGRYVIVGGVIAGIAIPDLASAVRPLLVPLLIASLVFALLQADLGRIRDYSKRWPMVFGLLFTLLILTPAVVALEATVVLVPYGLPESIADGMILAAMAPPLLAASVIAFLLGLDTLLALVVALVAHIVTPLTIAFLAHWLLGPDLSISIWELAQRLAVLIGGGFAIGLALRGTGLPRKLMSRAEGAALIDGLSVLCLTLLALALMDGVTALAVTEPRFVVLAFICGFLLNPLLQLIGAALFVKSGFQTALTVGLLAGYRNTGVVIAALAGSTDPHLLTFLAIVQIPTFLMPMVSSPVLRKVKQVGFDPA